MTALQRYINDHDKPMLYRMHHHGRITDTQLLNAIIEIDNSVKQPRSIFSLIHDILFPSVFYKYLE